MRSVPVNHRPRERGGSKYGVFDRLVGRHRRPLRGDVAAPARRPGLLLIDETRRWPEATLRARPARPTRGRTASEAGAVMTGNRARGRAARCRCCCRRRHRRGVALARPVRPACLGRGDRARSRWRRWRFSRCTSRPACSSCRARCWRSPPASSSACGGASLWAALGSVVGAVAGFLRRALRPCRAGRPARNRRAAPRGAPRARRARRLAHGRDGPAGAGHPAQPDQLRARADPGAARRLCASARCSGSCR